MTVETILTRLRYLRSIIKGWIKNDMGNTETDMKVARNEHWRVDQLMYQFATEERNDLSKHEMVLFNKLYKKYRNI